MKEVRAQARRPRGRAFPLVGLAVLLVLALAACDGSGRTERAASSDPTPPAATAPSSATRTNEAGAVTLKATWPGPSAGLAFTVVMDTHSVDLDAVDLGRSAVLRTDQGVEVKPSGWSAPQGGHRREGKLTFPDTGVVVWSDG